MISIGKLKCFLNANHYPKQKSRGYVDWLEKF